MLKHGGKGVKRALDTYLKSSDIWSIQRVWMINLEIVPHIIEHASQMRN
jgi:hypothetical protein